MNQNESKRRPRYKRDNLAPRPGRFQSKGDAEIVLLVHEYKYLTRRLLELLTGRRGTSLKNRLRFLYDHEYLWKIQFSRSYLEMGSSPDIYVLDEKGRQKYHEITNRVADPSPIRNQNRDTQLEHTLLINTVRAMVTEACNKTEGIELVYWQRSGKETKDKVIIDGKEKYIAPDAFFVLKRDGKPPAPFFLEADRSTMDQPTFIEKLSKYYAYYRSIREELDRQRGVGKKVVSNNFNIHGFRVLTVIEQETAWQKGRNRDRLANLIESGFKATDGKGWGGFWFTSKSYFDPKDPESIFGSIFQVAKRQANNDALSILD